MRKIVLNSLILCVAGWLTACGDSKKPAVPQISSFAFMQDAGGYLFTPTIGKYTTTGATTVFTVSAVLDPSTNQPVTGEFYSIILSPDGTTAAVDLYGGQDGDSVQWDIFVADSGGHGDLVPITNDAYADAMPQFSPNGQKVVFNSQRPSLQGSDQWQIVIREIGGTGELVLPMPLGADQTWAPTYSPDASKIAVEAWGYDSLGSYFEGIVVMKADGTNPKLLTNAAATCDCYDENPSFAADGTKIVFSRENWDSSTATESEDIYIMNADGSRVTPLTSGMGITFDPTAVDVLGVGPRILFSSNGGNPGLNGSSGFELFSMKLDGTEITRLTTNTLYDAFSSERYESGAASAQVVRGLAASRHLMAGHHVEQKVQW
ncbi:MAG TPA: hypothetical protein VGS27_05020 [Candidatus Sulfotelmatobacter sp.]|nr:hypothetical protein [Candidatus Sulfotelmatobacter sp.]